MKKIIKHIFSKAYKRIYNNKYYRWYVLRKKSEKTIRKSLQDYYMDEDGRTCNECVICIYNGTVRGGGLADRLKGIIGTYYISKKKGLPFKIYFKSPFPLESYFCCNTYDWTIREDEICQGEKDVSIVILDNTQDSIYQIRKQRLYLERKLKKDGKQKHVYTNASFAYDLNYSLLFNELFKPSPRLQKAIDYQKLMIGSRYISVSCRFLDLLGDFKDTCSRRKNLSEEEKKQLFQSIDNVIEELHYNNPDKKILVNSDSVTFLNRYKDCEYAYVIEGNVTHIDAQQDEYSYEKYEKTFLDFMMIANADSIYLIKSKMMHNSGYPYAASKIYEKKYEIIDI